MRYIRLGWPALLLLILPVMHLAGCVGPAYYSQAISGHLSLMRSRVPIKDLLADPSTDPQLAERLRQAESIVDFARQRLQLDGKGGYDQLAITGREAVTWNVVAAPEFSVDPRLWCFLVSGCVPYLGYFDAARAEKFADKLEGQSFDVIVSPALAYSTLGWFKDPLLDTMLQYSDAELAGIIIHELAHQKLYVKGDTAFSEAFATYVEETGVRLWLDAQGRIAHGSSWENRKLAGVQFNRLLGETRQKLQALYASGEPDETKRRGKSLLYQALKETYQKTVEADWKGVSYFANWMDGELNNAHLALINSYEGGVCAFAALYDQAGHDLQRFYTLSAEKAELRSELREAWLESPCQGTASVDES